MRGYIRLRFAIASTALVVVGLSVCPVEAQVDARRELQKVQVEYERYLRDESEYTERTQGHLNRAVETLMTTLGMAYFKERFGDDAAAVAKDLLSLKKNIDAGLRGDERAQAEILLKQIVGKVGSKVGAGKLQLSAVVDTVFHVLYLHQDIKQREILDRRRETLDRLREYWERRAAGRPWSEPPPEQPALDPGSADAIFQRAISQLGVWISTPAGAVADGHASIAAEARRGFELTDVAIINSSDEWLAMDFSGSYLVPSNPDSNSQRIGLVSVAAIDGAPITIGNQARVNRLTADTPRLIYARLAVQTNTQSVRPLARGHWVLLPPRGRSIITFHSVCLDRRLGTPTAGERFTLSAQPLPSRLQRLIMSASVNGVLPQSELWETIEADAVSWFDPRLTTEARLRRVRQAFGAGRYDSVIEEGAAILSAEPENGEAALLLGLSHYRIGLGTDEIDRAGDHYAQSHTLLRSALARGQEVSFPIAHHQRVILNESLREGVLTISTKGLRFRLAGGANDEFAVPLAKVYELRFEVNKAGRLGVRVGIPKGRGEDRRNYNFYSTVASVRRETAQLTAGLSISADSVMCESTCPLSIQLVYGLMKELPRLAAQ